MSTNLADLKNSPIPWVLPLFPALPQTEKIATKASQISYLELGSWPETEKVRALHCPSSVDARISGKEKQRHRFDGALIEK